MAKRVVTNAKTGEQYVDDFVFAPKPPKSPAEIDAEKDAAAESLLSTPVIESLMEEFIALTGVTSTPAEVKASAKARLKAKL